MRTRIKICGFTRVEDAVAAAELGVDAIGLVFYPPSSRAVTIEQAQRIVSALPAFCSVVALFVDEQPARIRQVLANVAIDSIQFHGDEQVADCTLYNKPYLKAIKVKPELDIMQLAVHYQTASALLLDAYHPQLKGGSGCQFNWNLVPAQCALPVVLAGGLQVDNVCTAIQSVKPYAVDVSSGVESEPGRKDVAKIAAFIQQAKAGDQLT